MYKNSNILRLGVAFLMGTTFLGSCKKEDRQPVPESQPVNEGLALLCEKNEGFEVGIIDNGMWGAFSDAAENIYFSGATWPESGISLRLGNDAYIPGGNGQWISATDPALRRFYGRELKVEFRQGERVVHQCDMYVPRPYSGRLISRNRTATGEIGKIGNTLTFSGKESGRVIVVVWYTVKDNLGATLSSGYHAVNSGDRFVIDGLIRSPEARSILLSVISGNAIRFTVDGKRILFRISAVDHHEYRIAS